MNSQMKEAIIKIIETNPGIKYIELMVSLTKDVKGDIEYAEMDRSLRELIQDGSIVEVDYVLPSMDYRAKPIFFPKGTVVNVKA